MQSLRESDVNPAFETWKSSMGPAKDSALNELVRCLRKHARAVSWNQVPARLREQVVDAAVWRAVKNLEKFNQLSKFSTWFHRIVINETNRALRKEQDCLEVPLDDSHDAGHEPSPRLDAKIQVDVLRAGRDDSDRALLDMVLGGLSFEEIGQVVGVSAVAARVRWTRLKARLRDAD